MSKVDISKSKNSEQIESARSVMATRQPVEHRLQNFVLIWLDAKLDESKKGFKKSLQKLRRIVTSVNCFTNDQECFKFIGTIKEEQVFMIVSGSLGQQVVPEFEKLPQLYAIYVFCRQKEFHEGWAKNFHRKVKGVYTKIEYICEGLQADSRTCDQSTVSISFNGVDPLFMYTQLLKEALLQIEDEDQKSIKELVEFCRLQNGINEGQIQKIEREYRDHSPIWWYTCESFMYSMLNRGLRIMDTDIILKMGFFIRHLHNHIQQLYDEQQSSSTKMKGPFTVYRGQGLSLESFGKMKKTKGGLMSFNNFLSTSLNREVSLKKFAVPATFQENSVGILFVITVDPQICRKSAIPFADVKDVGYYKGTEAELLFTTHTIFCIERIQRLHDENTDRLWKVNLTLVGNENHELNNLVSSLRDDVGTETGWSRLGCIFIRLGEPAKAEHLYKILLGNATTDADRAHYNFKFGWVYDLLGEYSKAIPYYEKYLEYKNKTVGPNDLSLAAVYNNIGEVYRNMGEYSKALSSHERSLEIKKIALLPNHPDLGDSYNNIGNVYLHMGEYSKALSSSERCLEIRKIALPANHPDLADSYNNIAFTYYNIGEYSKALSFYEQCLQIWKTALPPSHANFGYPYNSIGLIYNNLGEYAKARSSFEKAIEIREKALPPIHPDLATSYNDIGLMYGKMGNYKKSLTFLEKALDIRKKSLPLYHPDILKTETNITEIKKKLK